MSGKNRLSKKKKKTTEKKIPQALMKHILCDQYTTMVSEELYILYNRPKSPLWIALVRQNLSVHSRCNQSENQAIRQKSKLRPGLPLDRGVVQECLLDSGTGASVC